MCSHQFAFNAESPAIEEAIMMQLITADYYGQFIDDISDMHRLRLRVFGQRLDWDVEISGDMEIDEFDALHPAYLIQRASDNSIQGCVRMLPSTGAVHPRHYAAAGAAMLARLS
jgi:hypothetical protein